MQTGLSIRQARRAPAVTSCRQQHHQDIQYNIDFISSLKFENEIKSSLALNDLQFRNYPIAGFHRVNTGNESSERLLLLYKNQSFSAPWVEKHKSFLWGKCRRKWFCPSG